MSSESISQLPAATTVSLTDLIAVTQGSTGPGTGVTRAAPLSLYLSPNGQVFMTTTSLSASGMPAGSLQLRLSEARALAGSALPIATPTTGNFAVLFGPSTTQRLITESANSSTITDNAVWEINLPPTYIAGSNITVSVWCNYTLGSGTAPTHTLGTSVYLVANPGGTLSANLVTTAAQVMSTTAGNLTFTINGATLVPGARVLLQLQAIIQETAGHPVYASVFNVVLT